MADDATAKTQGPLRVGGAVAFVLSMLYLVPMTALTGQTVGKRMMGIRVVRTDGSRVSLPRFLFMRGLPVAILGVLPLLRYVMFLVDSLVIFRESRQCLHDNFADTKVVTAASSEAATLAGDSGANLRTISF